MKCATAMRSFSVFSSHHNEFFCTKRMETKTMIFATELLHQYTVILKEFQNIDSNCKVLKILAEIVIIFNKI